MYIKRDVLGTWNSDNIEKSIKKWATAYTSPVAWIQLLDGYISAEEVWQELYQVAMHVRDISRPDCDDEYNLPDFLTTSLDMARGDYGSMQGKVYWGMLQDVINGETPEPVAWRSRLEKAKREFQEQTGLVPYA